MGGREVIQYGVVLAMANAVCKLNRMRHTPNSYAAHLYVR